MINEYTRELIQGELDKTNTPEQSEEAKKLIASDPQAAAYFRDMQELTTAISNKAEVEPPHTLKTDIMDRIAKSEIAGYAEPIPVLSLLRKKLSFETTAIFSVGLAAGLALFFIFSGSEPSLRDGTNLYGTIASPENTHRFKVSGEGNISVEGASGHMVTQSADGVTLADLSLTCTGTVKVSVEFDSNVLSFRGFNQTTPVSSQFVVAGGTITFAQSGTGQYAFLFDNAGNNAGIITVRLTQNGQTTVKTFPIQ